MSSTELTHITVFVRDAETCRVCHGLKFETGLTLLAVMSEDPGNWDELASYWPRYRSPVVPDFLDGLFLDLGAESESRLEQAVESMGVRGDWIYFDLTGKRIFAGREIDRLGGVCGWTISDDERDQPEQAAVAADDDQHERGLSREKQEYYLAVHLPPWWELHESADASHVLAERVSPIEIPHAERTVLYGRPMLEDLAARMIRISTEGRLPCCQQQPGDDRQDRNDRNDRQFASAVYPLTVEVHREWLMTPRGDLKGRKPRDLLHGAHRWSDAVIEGQRQRHMKEGTFIACPNDVQGYDTAPMGREEMIIYFDLCRHLIETGWHWCCSRTGQDGWQQELNRMEILVDDLEAARDVWLQEPYEGGSPPQFIIDCSRRRVPRAVNAPIIGMDQREEEPPHIDCDCPICEMVHLGFLGVTFTGLDGHHLELDDEYAFSTEQYYEEWQNARCSWDEADEEADEDDDDELEEAEDEDVFSVRGGMTDRVHKDAGKQANDRNSSSPMGRSVWSSNVASAIPRDTSGHLNLAFRLAEIIGALESACAPGWIIRALNTEFRRYWQADASSRWIAKKQLFENLEAAAQRYPQLLGRVVDFQSLVDENHRNLTL
jgi:hypothetical protein